MLDLAGSSSDLETVQAANVQRMKLNMQDNKM